MRVFIVGASGGVGRQLLEEGSRRGHLLTAQTRTAGKVPRPPGVNEVVGHPTDPRFLTLHLAGQDAVVFVLGIDSIGKTTLFSDATRALIEAMQRTSVRRLVAVTGIGAGETRGHGGWLYNSIIYPFFTHHRYEDKDRQEALIEKSDLDWTIVRPAAYSERAVSGPLVVLTTIPADVQLKAISRKEVATFILDELETGMYRGSKPFVGHAA